ncbi:hypothetical protein EDC96DRAFT_539601 [Choanephora cucurbitarum]|nr:hypothetical protein EDC96DRAFT_539601 [Choanephora cucurbitarum]
MLCDFLTSPANVLTAFLFSPLVNTLASSSTSTINVTSFAYHLNASFKYLKALQLVTNIVNLYLLFISNQLLLYW